MLNFRRTIIALVVSGTPLMAIAAGLDPYLSADPTVDTSAGSSAPAPAPAASPVFRDAMPVTAKPGECYARVVNPPQYSTKSEQVLSKAASERIEIVPARYDYVSDQVLVKPAGKKIVEIIPAVYREVEEPVLLKAATEKIEEVPAVYKTETDTQLVKPATTMWKKGHGPFEKTDGLTGEIMCLVDVPAEYRTISRRVLVSPATTRRIPVAAQYGTIKRQELVKAAEVREADTPAEYKTVRTLKEVEPAQEKRIPLPAEYQTVTSQVLVSAGTAEWKSILCETNTTPGIVQDIQRALMAKGFNPGKIDGRVGVETAGAIRTFQEANGLSTGGLTMETLDRLGVSRNR